MTSEKCSHLEVVLTTYDTVPCEYERIRQYQQYINRTIFGFDEADEMADPAVLPPQDLERPRSLLYSFQWGRIVADEAQKLRGTKSGSKISQAVRSRRWQGGKRLFITGTPYLNYISDLAAIFAFLRISPLDDPATFIEMFCKSGEAPGPTLEGNPQTIILKMLKMALEAIKIQRLARDHLVLPNIIESDIRVDLDNNRRIDYWGNHPRKPFDPKTEFETQDRVRHLVKAGHPKYVPAAGEIMKDKQLRAKQNATHWAAHRGYRHDKEGVFDPAWKAEMQRGNNWESTKIRALIQSIQAKLREPDIKILVFDAFIPNIKLIGYGLAANNIDFVEVHSERPDKEGEAAIENFRAQGGPRILVATDKSLNAGVNLQRASVVYLVTPNYTPAIEQQCIARSYRMGQERDVYVYRLIANESLDERIRNVFQVHKAAQGQSLFTPLLSLREVVFESQLRNLTRKSFGEMMTSAFPDVFRFSEDDEDPDDVDVETYDTKIAGSDDEDPDVIIISSDDERADAISISSTEDMIAHDPVDSDDDW